MNDAPKIRWWPAGLIVLLELALLTHIWFFLDTIRQQKVVATIATCVLMTLLLLLIVLS